MMMMVMIIIWNRLDIRCAQRLKKDGGRRKKKQKPPVNMKTRVPPARRREENDTRYVMYVIAVASQLGFYRRCMQRLWTYHWKTKCIYDRIFFFFLFLRHVQCMILFSQHLLGGREKMNGEDWSEWKRESEDTSDAITKCGDENAPLPHNGRDQRCLSWATTAMMMKKENNNGGTTTQLLCTWCSLFRFRHMWPRNASTLHTHTQKHARTQAEKGARAAVS